jgi:chromosomal replication initiator protein
LSETFPKTQVLIKAYFSMDTIWQEVKTSIKENIPEHIFKMWINPITPEKGGPGCINLVCPNLFFMQRVQKDYGNILESEIKKVSGQTCRFVAGVRKNKKKTGDHGLVQMQIPGINKNSYAGQFLRKDLTFDHFVVGECNEFAYSAAFSLASAKQNNLQNSLFLLSKTGMGKSHLAQAIGRHVLSRHPSEQIYYVTAENFTREMINALQNNSIEQFKQKYRNGCDVLLLEDIQHLSGKAWTQIQLARILDSLYEDNKRILFSSCYLPVDIPKLNDELKSRLMCGLISVIEPPDFQTRVKILNQKTRLNRYDNISDDIIHYLATELTDDVRQLESGLIGVAAKSSLLGKPVDIELSESVVKNIVQTKTRITIESIKKLVCKEFNISVRDIVSPSRKKCFVQPRQIAMYLAHKYTDSPLKIIGKNFNRYHATALHSINVVESVMKKNISIRKQVEYLSEKLEQSKFPGSQKSPEA